MNQPVPHSPEHRAAVVVYPWRRVARTMFASGAVILPTALVVVPVILDAVQGFVPPQVYASLAGGSVAVLAAIALLNRGMQSAAFNRLLTDLGLGIVPKAEADSTVVVAVKDAAAAAAALEQLAGVHRV